MNPLIGRKNEIQRLRAHVQSRKSEFVVVYGRRRVGKTFLIRKAFENDFSFQLTGLANASMMQQLHQFHAALMQYRPDQTWEPAPATDWFAAFQQLIHLLENSTPQRTKKNVFLDELPWLDTQNSKFLSALEHFWNSWASARDDILLIVCGSAASWMLNHLIKNKGGLYNRITDRIKLDPFTLSETEEFLKMKNTVFDRYQIMLLFMVFGGIPFYLDLIKPGKSATQNINDLCFLKNAPFRLEYDNLYASLFNKHERHIAVIEAIASKGKGLTRTEVIHLSKLPDGGGLTRILDELEESSFIRRYKSFGKKQKESLYQLIDNYSLFYLRFIKKVDRDEEHFWINLLETPAFYSWAGYAFEMVCLRHIYQIKQALGISGVQTSISTWRSPGAQIDLLIDRKDQVINICEMKFSINPFNIDKKYAEILRNKMGNFRQVTDTKKALFLTMITTYGLDNSKYSGLVQNSLDMNILFD
jgi:AAA+ ATPase superfamily predicted ATPase